MGELSNNQRVLILREIFTQESDEDHKLSMEDIYEKMAARVGSEFDVNTKSIKSDIKTLTACGFNIDTETVKKGKKLYYYQDRDFELYELRMLIDAVSSAKFISASESEGLINKLKKLTSRHLAKELQHQIYMESRVKCADKCVRFYIDKIHKAIGENCKIKFQYGCYDVDKNFNFNKGGRIYIFHPYALVWERELYYLVGFYEGKDVPSHCRVDRMRNVELTEERFEKKDLDVEDHLRKSFNMYTGDVLTVKLCFSNSLINYVIERFGMDIEITRRGEDYFEITFEASVSIGLIRWIMSWGSGVTVLSPASLREKILEETEKIGESYHMQRLLT